MHIPSGKLEAWVRDLADQCLISQQDRQGKGEYFANYFLFGADDPANAAIYNKTFAYIDDLQSLLFSPVSLRFHIGDSDLPNVLEEAKGRAAASKIRAMSRKTDTDSSISDAVLWSLVKGKTILKQSFKRGHFSPSLIQPELFGVLRENHDKLDEDMEAFVHTMWITPYQFSRMIAQHPDKAELEKRGKNYMRQESTLGEAGGTSKQIVVGGLYPFQPAGTNSQPTANRGMVDWMSRPQPMLSPEMSLRMMRLDELWVWNDKANDWATFQIIGDDMLIHGKYQITNMLAYNVDSQQTHPDLRGKHPFIDFCPNRIDGYFWGRSEIVNVALLQEAINARINGVNKMLRKQEDPPTKFIGSTGVNQQALSRFNKAGGYWTDSNPTAKVDRDTVTIPQDVWGSLNEYERMFDEMGGLPPTARGHGEAGVRSQAHAETLIRMFSPRFKDRALLIERDVEALGSLMLDLARAHVPDKMAAWVGEADAGVEGPTEKSMLVPPAKGMVPVMFSFADLSEDVSLTIDSHSSSPAFAQEAKSLAFDLLKIGAMSPEQVVERMDVSDPEELIAGITRRGIAKAEHEEKALAIKAAAHAPKGHGK